MTIIKKPSKNGEIFSSNNLVDSKKSRIFALMITEQTHNPRLFKTGRALRYNSGKLRYDLLEPYAIQELVRVFTKGAEKYEDHNWLKGMDWSMMRASAGRHLAAWDMGEDIDQETGCQHLALAAWNILGLVSYSKYWPELDDRLCKIVERKKKEDDAVKERDMD